MTDFQHDYMHFDARTYLEEYYASLPPENIALLRFLVNAFADVAPDSLALDFGCGPMLYTPIAGAHRVREMHLCEYLTANRDEIAAWLKDDAAAFDWSATIRAALEIEGVDSHAEAIRQREGLMRQRVTCVMPCDLRASFPLDDPTARGRYDVLSSSLCAEAVAQNTDEYARCLAHFADLLRPGGRLILAAVKNSQAYTVGRVSFPVLALNEQDVIPALHRAGFVEDSIRVDSTQATHPIHPYDGLMFFTAHKAYP